MTSESSEQASFISWKRKAMAAMIVLFPAIMMLTNPTEKGFRKFMQEYETTESGATIAPQPYHLTGAVARSNYYLYSTYNVNISGIEHHYLGMFGSFHNYY